MIDINKLVEKLFEGSMSPYSLRSAVKSVLEILIDDINAEIRGVRESIAATEAASVQPVCETCNDSHLMWLTDRQVPCTRCPSPCGLCRAHGGAYCQSTPCPCVCHKDPLKLARPIVVPKEDPLVVDRDTHIAVVDGQHKKILEQMGRISELEDEAKCVSARLDAARDSFRATKRVCDEHALAAAFWEGQYKALDATVVAIRGLLFNGAGAEESVARARMPEPVPHFDEIVQLNKRNDHILDTTRVVVEGLRERVVELERLQSERVARLEGELKAERAVKSARVQLLELALRDLINRALDAKDISPAWVATFAGIARDALDGIHGSVGPVVKE